MKMRKIGNDGFSLVEIIIVVAIMAVLAAALAPQLIKYIEKSRANICQHNMGIMRDAIEAEISEKGDGYKFGSITDLSTIELYDGTKCSGKGTYTVDVKDLGNGNFSIDIECSKHGKFIGNS